MFKRRFFTAVFVFIFTAIPLIPAQVGAEFNPNFIISDYDFTDQSSMTMEDIFLFLKKRGILFQYTDPITRLTPSQIIYDAARVYHINPKVLLTLLQKEQSLVEDQTPIQSQYDWATGFAVCDDCSTDDPLIQKFKGFTNQVTYAAKQFRKYLDESNLFRMKTGLTYSIDGVPVTILNDATRALLTYTPHLHGNELFYTIWNRWFAKLYPDSSVVLERETKKYFLVQNGYKRAFKSKSVFLSRFNLNDAVIASKSDLDKYPNGPIIAFPEYSLLRSPKGTVYLLVNDKKRGFTSKDIFKKIGFNPSEVIPVTQPEIDAIPEGEPLTLTSIYPTGALLQEKGFPGVYFVQDGIRHPIKFKELLKLNFPQRRVIQVPGAELASYNESDPIRLKDGLVAKSASDPTIFFISNGQKRPFASELAFKTLGHSYSTVITVPQGLLDLHQTGESIDTPT